MLRFVTAATLAATLMCAGQAAAKVVEITLTGVVASGAPGTQPAFDVGDVLTMSARFDDSGPLYVPGLGGVVDQIGSDFAFHMWPLPTSGDQFWRLEGEGFTWASVDDYLDGWAGPIILMDSSYRLKSVSANLVRSGSSTVPYVELHDDRFRILPGDGLYANTSDPGNWFGSWDFAGATVKVDGFLVAQGPVPEPSTWAMMLMGFFGLGAAIRSRRARASAAFTIPA